MKKDLCEIVVILDESGSMSSVKNDTIGGFNTFLETHQKLPGFANLTFVKFDTSYNIVYNGKDVKEVPPLNEDTYTPHGCTALLDAVGKTIDEVGIRLSNTNENERPEKVMFVILTDGEENSSREYHLDMIKEKIKHQTEKYNWDFIFLGANQDAWSSATSMGMSNAINYAAHDISNTLKRTTLYSANFRSSSPENWNAIDYAATSYSKSEEEINKDLKDLVDNQTN